ncbi:hypothetical protein C8R44DRAFT_759815, partial [Mycena epipterygia]
SQSICRQCSCLKIATSGSHHRASSRSLSSINFLRWYSPLRPAIVFPLPLNLPNPHVSAAHAVYVPPIYKAPHALPQLGRLAGGRRALPHSLWPCLPNAIPTTTPAFYCTRDIPAPTSAVPSGTQAASRNSPPNYQDCDHRQKSRRRYRSPTTMRSFI